MAKRGAPEPDFDGPDPDGPVNSTPWPFFGAVAVIALISLLVLFGQVFASDDIDDTELINRTVGDYVRAHNDNDQRVLEELRCDELAADRAPFADREEVEFGGSGNVTVEDDRATVDVTVVTDEQRQTEVWEMVRIDDRWRVCNP